MIWKYSQAKDTLKNHIYLMKTSIFIAGSENITEHQAGKVLHYLHCIQVSFCTSKAGSTETNR